MKKKIIGIMLVIALLVTSLAGCSSKTENVEEPSASEPSAEAVENTSENDGQESEPETGAAGNPDLVIGVTLAVGTNPFHQAMQKGMEEMLCEGQKLIVSDANQDVAKQISDIEDMIQQGVDVMLVDPVDSNGITAALQACERAGIPVIAFNSPVEEADLVKSTVASDNYMAGQICAEALAEAIGGKGEVAMYNYSIVKVARDRSDGFIATIEEKYPDIEIVNQQEGLPSVDGAMPAMESILQSNPDIVGMFALNDPAAIGCIAAIESAGKLGQISVVGVDGSDDGIAMIKDGKMLASAAQDPDAIGKTAVETAYKVLDGEEVEKDIVIPVFIVDKSNAE